MSVPTTYNNRNYPRFRVSFFRQDVEVCAMIADRDQDEDSLSGLEIGES
jgi:hypothetical protein